MPFFPAIFAIPNPSPRPITTGLFGQNMQLLIELRPCKLRPCPAPTSQNRLSHSEGGGFRLSHEMVDPDPARWTRRYGLCSIGRYRKPAYQTLWKADLRSSGR